MRVKSFIFGSLTFFSLTTPTVLVSCYQQKNVFADNFDYKIFTQNQLYTLNNRVEFSSIFNETDHEKINKFIKNNKNLNYISTTFATIIKSYSENDLIHSSLLRRNKIKNDLYNNENFLPEIQLIIYDIYDNYDYYKRIYPNLIDIKNIRSISYLNNTEQIFYLENLIALNLNRYSIDSKNQNFNVKIKDIHSIEDNTAIKFKIELNGKNIDNEFYLKGFFSYKYVNNNYNFEDDDNKVRFNEYLSDIKMNFSDKRFNIINFDSLVDNPRNSYNLLTFIKLISDFSQSVELEVPEYRKNIDKSYKLIFKPNKTSLTKEMFQDYFFTVIVTKNNGEVQYYDWNSINFTNHYHLFNGYKDSNNIRFSYPSTTSIKFNNDPNEFVREKLSQILIETFDKYKDNLLVFNNKRMNEIEAYEFINYMPESIKFIQFQVYKEVIQYFPPKNIENYLTEVKFLNFNIDKSIPGKIYFNIDLLNNNNQSLIDQKTRQITFEISGFKGYKNI